MGKFEMKKRLRSFKYAFNGIKILLANEHNAWIHSVAAVVVIVAGLAVGLSRTEWLLVILCIGMVFAAEAMNTAIERLTDLYSPDYHPKAGAAKDLAAGAVLITAMAAAVVGLWIFLPKLIALWKV